ncbi:MAG: hypothetical protein GY863_14600 [bacterium]|nr:hypothetical protein [bacterium]
MHLGETLLVLGALVIFSITALYINDTKFDNDITMMETEFRITAVSIAQTYIEEAQTLSYDEVLISGSISDLPDDFTSYTSLGNEGGESYPNFDDVDDYNGYSQNVVTPRADYDVSIKVSYADTLNCTPDYSNESFFKILEIKVKSDFFQDSLSCSYLFSFYKN